jgi:hypothetical protein
VPDLGVHQGKVPCDGVVPGVYLCVYLGLTTLTCKQSVTNPELHHPSSRRRHLSPGRGLASQHQ